MRRLAQGLGEEQSDAFNTAVLAELEILAGNPEQALVLAQPARPACAEAGGFMALAYLMVVHGRALAGAGRSTEAAAALRAAAGTATELQDAWQHAQAALALARLQIDPVAEHLAAAHTYAGPLGSPWVAAVADHLEGLAIPDAGRAEDAALAAHVAHGYALDVVDTLEALAGLAAGQQSWAEAAHLHGATGARREELGYYTPGRPPTRCAKHSARRPTKPWRRKELR